MAVTHNLTRAEAAERSRLLAVDDYDVVLDLVSDERYFKSLTTVRFACRQPGVSTFIEIAATEILSATLNGREIDVSQYSASEGLRLDDLEAHNTLVIMAKCPFGRDGEGLHKLTDPVDGESYVYTHFEANNAQLMYACFDQPDLKARFRLRVTVPAGWHAVSNMPAKTARKSGKTKTVVFDELPPTSTYLTALCAGRLHEVVDTHDGITLSLFCRSSMAEHLDSETLFALTKTGLDHFHQHFGYRYPLPKYDQIAMPEYNSGATENFGLVVFAEQYFVHRHQPSQAELDFRSYVMYHEMAHMWFGDLVTPPWWDETWLKESFATWAGFWAQTVTGASDTAWATFAATEKNAAFLADSLSTTHPVHTSVSDVKLGRTNFDAITYAKGASLIKQLAAYVGIAEFCAGLRAYFNAYAWSVADFANLLQALETTTGADLSHWGKQWLTTTGFNRLRASFDVDDDGKFAHFALRQDVATGDKVARDQRVKIGLYDAEAGRLSRRAQVDCVISGTTTEIEELRSIRKPDLVLLNDDDLSYVQIALDPASRSVVMTNLAALPDPTARAVAWTTAWNAAMWRDVAAARDFITLITTALPLEDCGGTVVGARHLADWVLRHRLPLPELFARYAQLTDAAWRGLNLAEPGSGVQRSWMDIFSHYARREGDVIRLRRWLAGEDLPTGIHLDDQIRWQLRHGLAAAGGCGPADIDQAVSQDTTISGEESALTARAALPVPADKARAFERLEDLTLSNTRQRAILRGFWEADQSAVTGRFVKPYLDLIDRLWVNGLEERAGAAAAFTRMLPGDEATLAALRQWLEADRPASLRRHITESADLMAGHYR